MAVLNHTGLAPGNSYSVSVPRTCSRCGARFASVGRENACPSCRKPRSRERSRDPLAPLTFRERQIVSLVRQAKANKEIAYDLVLTTGTVKEYLYRIFRKLHVHNRTELAILPKERLAS